MRSIPLLSLYSDKQVSKLRVGGVTWNVTCYRHTHATSVEIKAVDLGIPELTHSAMELVKVVSCRQIVTKKQQPS